MTVGQIEQPSTLYDRLRKLEREVAELRKGRTLSGAAISRGGITLNAGGGLTITDGGSLSLFDGDGTEIVFMGPVQYGDEFSSGFIFARDNGNHVFELAGDPNNQYWALRDEAGNHVVGDDAATGRGLARPYLPYAMYPFGAISGNVDGSGVDFRGMVGKTSTGGYQTLWAGEVIVHHPRVRFMYEVNCSGGATGTDVRLQVAGSTLVTHPVSYTASPQGYDEAFAVPGWGTSVNVIDKVRVEIQGQASSGTIYARPLGVYGVQS